jgi:arylsulfatase A-like enzyme
MNYFKSGVILGISSGLFVSLNPVAAHPVFKGQAGRPNVIFILADDLGYGDLSCYGQTKFKTPNIDQLAASGIRFTNHYSGCTVCAPSRSSLMTGLNTGHTYIRGNKSMEPEGQEPLPSDVYTVAELFKDASYATGAFGKWGLGGPGTDGAPGKQGFDEFFGFNCQSLAHNYYPEYLWHNDQKVLLEGNKNGVRGSTPTMNIIKWRFNSLKNIKMDLFFCSVPILFPMRN